MDVESIVVKAAASIVTDLFKKTLTGVADTFVWVKKASHARDPLGFSANQYAMFLEKRYGSVRVLGMQKALPIDRIYVGANILEQPTVGVRASIDELENAFDKDRRSLSPIVSTLPASDLLERQEFVVNGTSVSSIRDKYNLKNNVLNSMERITALTFSSEKVFRQTLLRLCPISDISLALDNKWDSKKGSNRAERFVDELAASLSVRPKHYVLLGKPGAGKTTFLKHLTSQALKQKRDTNRLPIFVSLKDWSDSKLELMPYITREFAVCDFKEPELFVKRALERGTCLVLFDGIDEVRKTKQAKIVRDMEKFCQLHGMNQFVITCRIAAYGHWFSNIDLIEIADFQDNQIQNFIKNWFLDNPQIANSCWKKLQHDPAIRELATTPLLLTLLCLSFEQTLDFPSNRSELYREGIDALLRKWDSSRGINRGEIYKHLSPQRKESMLAYIAANFFKRDEYFFPQRTLEKYISDFVDNLPGADDGQTKPDSTEILEEMEAQHGVIVTRAIGIYSFSHLTFQEYFCARFAIQNADDVELQELIHNSLKPNWREVVLLAAGMLPRADNFLELLARKIRTDTLTPFVIEILDQCSTLCRVGSPFKKTTAFSLALLARTRQSTGSDDLLSKTLSLCRVVAKSGGDMHVYDSLSLEPSFGIGKNYFKSVTHKNVPSKAFHKEDELLAWVEAASIYFECLCNEAYADKSIRSILSEEILTLT